jgi:hypothetical protein
MRWGRFEVGFWVIMLGSGGQMEIIDISTKGFIWVRHVLGSSPLLAGSFD